MRVVAIADTHMYHDDLGTLPEGDVLIHAGDMLQRGSLEELTIAAQWLRSLPHEHKIFVAGNHDVCFEKHPEEARRVLGSELVYLEDSQVLLRDARIWGSPWQPAFNDWAFNLSRGAPLAAKWSLIPDGLDILITHGPPLGFGDHGSRADRFGCADLLDATRRVRPRVHLFGHLHQDGGAWQDGATWILNVTTWESDRAPTVFDIDARGVRLVSVPSSQLP